MENKRKAFLRTAKRLFRRTVLHTPGKYFRELNERVRHPVTFPARKSLMLFFFLVRFRPKDNLLQTLFLYFFLIFQSLKLLIAGPRRTKPYIDSKLYLWCIIIERNCDDQTWLRGSAFTQNSKSILWTIFPKNRQICGNVWKQSRQHRLVKHV